MGLGKGCPCCNVYNDNLEFKKVMHLENAGLVVYHHTTPVNSVAFLSQPEKAFNKKDNAYIIQNTKNRNVSTSNYMSEFEETINCPRCRYLVKHTKELLLNVPMIRKNDVIGICDHCRFKKRDIERCNKCKEVVKEFLKYQEQKLTQKRDSDKHEKIMISKIKNILKDAPKAVQIGKSKTKTRSETSLKNLSCRSPTYHVPRVKDMFDIQKRTEKTNQYLKKGFLKQMETTKLYKNKSDSEITFIEASNRQEHNEPRRNILFNSTENIAWPESLKESAELIGLDNKRQRTLKQKLKSKIEVDLTLKRLPSTELHLNSDITFVNETSSEDYLRKENYMFSKADYGPQKLSPEEQSIQKEEILKNRRQYHRSYDDIHHSKYYHDVATSSQNKLDIYLRGIQKQSKSVYKIRRYSSEETLQRSASATREYKLHKDFSYFFLKETDVVKKTLRKQVSSSELIKDTQDMYHARAEEERIKKEQELKRKFEAEEKKRLAKNERKKRLEEERRLEEMRKKMAEKDRIKAEKIDEEEDLKKDKKKSIKQDIESQEKSVKTSKETSGKSKSIKLKTEIKESKMDKSLKSERDSVKSKKEIDKQEKQELMRLEKERKLKEKSEKEEQMRKAKEEKQKQNEEKEREKSKKEEAMRRAAEAKQRQKEEREKEKAKKEEEMRRAKEEKQREKEEKEKEKAKKEEEMRIAKEEKQREKEARQTEKEESRRQKGENDKNSKDNDNKSKQKQPEQQLLAKETKEKEKEAKIKKKLEEEAKKQEAHLKLKSLKETKVDDQSEKPQSKKVIEEPKIKELNINQVKIRKTSPDDLILQLVKLKQTQGGVKERPTRMSQLNISKKTIFAHKDHKYKKTKDCLICLDSDLELDIENIVLNETKPEEINEIIMGQKILKYKPPLVIKKEDKGKTPLFFSSTQAEGENIIKTQEVIENIEEEKEKKPPILSTKYVDQDVPKGIIRYALSDRTFIEKGWTMLPTEKVVRKMNVYRMRPAHPEFDWFEHNKSKKLICYDTGEKLAEFDDNGKGRWFYRNGRVALDYYDAEEINAQQRIIIFSSGEPDERGSSRPFAILATFDYLGNGIVFDHSGKIRLKYNQTEGVVLDRAIGPVSHWKWHTLNDPPVLQQVMIDTQMAHKDPEILKLGGPHDDKPRPDNEEMLAIEFDNFIKEKSKKLSQKFKPFQIKMKALKINEYFSLKVLDQATIYLIYRDGSTNLKLNIGMILDHQEIVDTDTAEVGEVSNSLERFPARTDSLAGLQKSVAHAQRAERARVERAQRLRPTQPCASVDRLTAGLSRPRPLPPEQCPCKYRKPSTTNLYYDTRLI